MKKDLPAMPFYIGDWKKDPAVQVLTREEKMIWFEIIMLMWESEERGYLTINKLPITNNMLSIALNLVNLRLTSTLTKFRQLGLFSVREPDKAIYSRKIIKILELSAKRTKTGSLGGNPRLVNQRLTKGLTKGLTKRLTKGKAGGLPNAENENETLISINNVVTNTNTSTSLDLEKQKIDFEIFWSLYDKKVGRTKSEKKWNKFSKEIQEKILEYIPKYKLAQPDKKFRQNPETFFNNETWNDEIIENKKKSNESKQKININIDTIDHHAES